MEQTALIGASHGAGGWTEVIVIEGVGKSFTGTRGDVQALENVNLSVKDNEFVTILGPSGCGKTTLLRAIAGLTQYDGVIRIDGDLVNGPGPNRSMVFQGFALLPWKSVLANVAFGLEVRGVPKSEREDKARQLIKLLGLGGFEQMMPHELSGGMQQRVGLARALAVEPGVLLMDEPFSALDEQTRRLLQEELLDVWETRRTTVVFVTHSMEEAVLLGDRVVLMGPRPGSVREIVEIPLARPRSAALETREGAIAFGEITSSLWHSLRSMYADSALEMPA